LSLIRLTQPPVTTAATAPVTVAELPEFSRRSAKLLSEAERQDIICFLAHAPMSGVLIEGCGGIRKLRWRRGNKGKSGGLRIVYYFCNDHMPLYLITLFAKGDRANLTQEERNGLRELVDKLITISLRKLN
jgi:hypothetical protein